MPDQVPSATAPGSAPARRPRIRQRLRTPLEARQWRRRVAAWVVGGLAFVLVVNALVGENGYLAIMRARTEERQLQETLESVRGENRGMRQKIDRLRTDPEELENAARQLRMSKPGEKMIIVTPRATPAAPAPASPSK